MWFSLLNLYQFPPPHYVSIYQKAIQLCAYLLADNHNLRSGLCGTIILVFSVPRIAVYIIHTSLYSFQRTFHISVEQENLLGQELENSFSPHRQNIVVIVIKFENLTCYLTI